MLKFIEGIFDSIGKGGMEAFLGILILVCLLAITGLILWGLFVAVDSWFLPRNHDKGRIVNKTFTPAHNQIIYIYNDATKTSMPQIIYHSDDWSVYVQVDDKHDSISISKKFYDSLKENDVVMVEYVIGRFSKDIYIKAISSL